MDNELLKEISSKLNLLEGIDNRVKSMEAKVNRIDAIEVKVNRIDAIEAKVNRIDAIESELQSMNNTIRAIEKGIKDINLHINVGVYEDLDRIKKRVSKLEQKAQ